MSYYTPTGTPGYGTFGASSPVRSEFILISQAFALLPALGAGVAGQIVVANSGGTALTTTSTLQVSTAGDVLIGTSADAPGTAGGSLVFPATGTGQRIYGDLSNGTLADRLLFQTTTINNPSNVGVIPNGAAQGAGFGAYNSSSPNNSSVLNCYASAATVGLNSLSQGSGTLLPLAFQIDGIEKMRLNTAGNFLIGGTSDQGQLLQVYGTQINWASTNSYFAGLVVDNTNTGSGAVAAVQIMCDTVGLQLYTQSVAAGGSSQIQQFGTGATGINIGTPGAIYFSPAGLSNNSRFAATTGNLLVNQSVDAGVGQIGQFVYNANVATAISVTNINAGSAADASFVATSNAGNAIFDCGSTTAGFGGRAITNHPNGMAVGVYSGTGPLALVTNAVVQFEINSAGAISASGAINGVVVTNPRVSSGTGSAITSTALVRAAGPMVLAANSLQVGDTFRITLSGSFNYSSGTAGYKWGIALGSANTNADVIVSQSEPGNVSCIDVITITLVVTTITTFPTIQLTYARLTTGSPTTEVTTLAANGNGAPTGTLYLAMYGAVVNSLNSLTPAMCVIEKVR